MSQLASNGEKGGSGDGEKASGSEKWRKKNKRGMSGKAEKPKKRLGKKAKIALAVGGWVLLLGVGAGAALLIKPAPEVVHTDAVVEAYKFAKMEAEKVVETVDDLDYYGRYETNPLNYVPLNDGGLNGVYIISGLKDKVVEEKINNRIKEVASALCDIEPSGNGVFMLVRASLFNVLSISMSKYIYNGGYNVYEYLTFDLNTGNELAFDDLFSPGVNLNALLAKSFYDGLAADVQFKRLDATKRLRAEERYPDPTKCMVQYCPLEGETYDSIRALIAEYDARLADMEQIATNALQEYLAGEKKFYLNSYGPALVMADGTVIKVELEDNIRYAIYLKNYRLENSIYENEVSSGGNPFFTENPGIDSKYINEETDSYLFDYAESKSYDDVPDELYRVWRDYVKQEALAVPGDAQKFRHILVYDAGVSTRRNSMYGGGATMCIYETDKTYYDSTYRKAVIDGKTQEVSLSNNQPARIGRYDEDKVVKLLQLNDWGCRTVYGIITSDGEVLDSVDEILVNPDGDAVGWKEYLNQLAYTDTCTRTWTDRICYSEEEKRAHELVYELSPDAVYVRLKDGSESGTTNLYSIDITELPRKYVNPKVFIK